MIIAIDGPSGAGKSSVSREVARKLGFSCLDTGAMYRSIAWMALDHAIDLGDSAAVESLVKDACIDFLHKPGDPIPYAVLLNGKDITDEIRSAEVDRVVSLVSAVPAVRNALVKQQQRIGYAGNYVVEGRDIGTTVFPDAHLKIFLYASDEERARRRVIQNEQRGVGSTTYETVLEDIRRRDELDASREASPLVQAEDAIRLDSTNLSFNDVVDRICDLMHERMDLNGA